MHNLFLEIVTRWDIRVDSYPSDGLFAEIKIYDIKILDEMHSRVFDGWLMSKEIIVWDFIEDIS